MIVLKAALVAIVATMPAVAYAADCPRKDVLGTSRVMLVDPAKYPRVGLKSFPDTLPLADKEVVLTFDDGPYPPTTTKVLAALADQCVQATFFLIGKNAQANPTVVKKIAAGGHSIGHHTWSHPDLGSTAEAEGLDNINRGIAADEAVLHGAASSTPSTPFFRFPGFRSTPAFLANLQSRGIAVFGADLWASDWNPMTPEQELQLLTSRLEESGKGIILLHDTKTQTAKMLPAFLQYLRHNNYKVVHLEPLRTVQSSSRDQ